MYNWEGLILNLCGICFVTLTLILPRLLLWWWFSCSVVSDPLRLHDCSPPGSSVHGIFQARILEWVAVSFSRGASQPRDRSLVSYIAGSLLHCRRILHWHQGSRFVIAGKHNGLPQGDSPSCPPLKDSKEVNGEGTSPWADVYGVAQSRTRLK